MKAIRNSVTVLFAILLVFGLVSCDLLMSLFDVGLETGTTIVERIEAFETDLNEEDRSYIAATHFHPDMQNIDQLAQSDTLTTGPLSYANSPYTLGEPVVVTTGTTERATVSFENFYGATGTIVFVMELDGTDYKIRRLTLTLDNVEDQTPYELYFYEPNSL